MKEINEDERRGSRRRKQCECVGFESGCRRCWRTEWHKKKKKKTTVFRQRDAPVALGKRRGGSRRKVSDRMTKQSYHEGGAAVKPQIGSGPRRPSLQSPKLAEGPFALAGEIRPGNYVYLYHRPDPDAECGFEIAPAYRLHVAGDNPLACTCPDKRCTHGHEPRYICKHMAALSAQIALATCNYRAEAR